MTRHVKRPSILDIAQSEELQRLGLCKNAQLWVDKNGQYASRPESGDEHKGPLGTASECFPEIEKFTEHGWRLHIDDIALWIIKQNDVFRRFTWETYTDPNGTKGTYTFDQAFRQVLIEFVKNKNNENYRS